MHPRLLFPILTFSLSGMIACQGDTTAFADSATILEVVSGTNQTGVVAQNLDQSLGVRVIHPFGLGVPGVEIDFQVVSGGGVLLPSAGAAASTISVVTDDRGVAEASWRLGPVAGLQSVTATFRPAGGDAIVRGFSVTALPGSPAPTAVEIGNLLEPLGEPVTVRVWIRDEFRNPIPDAVVGWQVVEGEGSFQSSITVTDAAGFTSTLFTPSAAGSTTVAAVLEEEPIATSSFFAVSARAMDPSGDTFSAPDGRIAPDIVSMGAWVEAQATLHVHIQFAKVVVADGSGAPNEVLGVLEFDTDQDAGTGGPSLVDLLNADMGVEYLVVIGSTASGDFDVLGFNGSFEVAGSITPVFSDRLLTLSIPLSLIDESDAGLDMAVFVGTPNGPGSSRRVSASWIREGETIAVTDFAPGSSPLSTQ